ncbi:MAG: VWA domain-containing protein [Candidatus Aenigmatarchaeota archaeon]
MPLITFTDPGYLWFLFIIPIFFIMHYLSEKAVKKKAFKFANYRAVENVLSSNKWARAVFRSKVFHYYIFLGIRTAILLLLVFAVSGTTIHFFGESNNFDFVITIDTSLSMLADDMQPSRLDAAKQAAKTFVDSLDGQTKVGVVSFSSVAGINQMPTTDIGKARGAIEDLEVSRSGGTAIGDAIVTSANLLYGSSKAKVIILLTDGQNNVGLDPEYAIYYARKDDIVIHTIGIGTEQGATFVPGVNVTSRLDTSMMAHIANETDGLFFRARDANELVQSYKYIASSSFSEVSLSLSLPLLLIAFMLLFAEWQLANLRYKVIP